VKWAIGVAYIDATAVVYRWLLIGPLQVNRFRG